MGQFTMNVTEDTYDNDVCGFDGYVLLDFWGETCPPCRMLSPILEELGRKCHNCGSRK